MKRLVSSFLASLLITQGAFAATVAPKKAVVQPVQQPTAKQQQQIKATEAFNAQRFNKVVTMPQAMPSDLISGEYVIPEHLEAEGFIEYHGEVLAVGGDAVK